MKPLIFMTVGYITGFIWGLYFNMNIVPIIFILIFLIYIFREKLKSYKIMLILMIIFMVISNIRILHLEDKFNTLYAGLDKIEVIGTINSEGQEKEYKTEYKIKVESINGDKKYKNTNLILYIKSKEKIEYGKKIKFIRRISRTNKSNKL